MASAASLLAATQELVDQVLKFESPADKTLAGFFKRNAALGQRDRGVIAESVYAVLRFRLEFAQLAQSGAGPMSRRLALLGMARAVGTVPSSALNTLEGEWLARLARIDRRDLPIEVRANLPEWLLARLRTRFSDDQISDLADSLNQPAPLDLRVNVLKSSREDVLAALAAMGVVAQATPFAPYGIRVDCKPALQTMKLFTEGAIEVQDEGSQLLAHVVAPRRGELVIDFCAGAGGKTLALGALMRSTGRLYALDVSARRLTKLKPRMARSGLSNVHPMAIDNERDARLKRLAGKADRVLVDAPCSGLGTVRRNPDLKWRQGEEAVAELAAKQAAILSAAARLVRPGGTLVYATCSLLIEENETIVDAFLADNSEFEESDVRETLRVQGIALDTGPRLSLWTHLHGTDGFFAAVLTRKT